MNLTHRQLEVFHAVMTAGSVTAAAQRLHTSQPTISRELQRIEQILQYALYERRQGKLLPTARALQLFEEVEQSWQGLAHLNAFAKGLREFGGSKLIIGCLPALATSLIPEACKWFCQAFPEAVIQIKPTESPWLEEGLSAQRFDLGLVEQEWAAAAGEAYLLLEMEEVCILPQNHPLLSKSVLAATDFQQQRFISLAANDPYRITIDKWFEDAGVNRKMQIETTSAASVCSLVKAGQGVAIINPLTALDFSSNGLHLRRLAHRIPFQIRVVKPLYRPANPLIAGFEGCLHKAIGAMQQRLDFLLDQT